MKTITLKMPSETQLRKTAVLLACFVCAFFLWGQHLVTSVLTRFQLAHAWQAVYLLNGNLYMGQLRSMDDKEIILQNAYYASFASKDGVSGQTAGMNLQNGTFSSMQLVRWGFNQPMISAGTIHIERSAVMFWESLSSDAEAVKQIESSRR